MRRTKDKNDPGKPLISVQQFLKMLVEIFDGHWDFGPYTLMYDLLGRRLEALKIS